MPGKEAGTISFALDNTWTGTIGMLAIPSREEVSGWMDITIPVKPVKGVHALILQFMGDEHDNYKVKSIRFSGKNISPPHVFR